MVLSQCGEGFKDIVDVGLDNFTLDEHIIHEHLHVLPDLVFENFIYKVLISYTYNF